MPQLIFYVGRDYPQIFEMSAAKVSIGRNKDNDITLTDSRVSVYHAAITREKDGKYRIKDLNSQNGTVVNSKPVEETVLKDGDRIRIGAVRAIFLASPKNPVASFQPPPAPKSKPGKAEESRRESLEKEIQSKTKKLAGLEKEIQERNRAIDAIQVGNTKIGDLEKESETLNRKNEKVRVNLSSLVKEIESAQQMQAGLQSGLEEKKNELATLDKERSSLVDETHRVRATIEESISQKDQLQVELEEIHREIEKARGELEETSRASEEAAAALEEAKGMEAKIGAFEAELKALEEKSGRLAEEISRREETGEKLANEISECEKNKEKLKEDIAGREKLFEERGNEIAGRNRDLEKLNDAIEQKRKNAEKLSGLVRKNDGLLKAFGEKLATMDSKLKDGLEDLTRTQETRKSLKKESLSLSKLIVEKTAVLQQLKQKITSRKHGTEGSFQCPPLRVINPELRSLVDYFHHGAGNPEQDRAVPVGYNGLAACTVGSIHREAETLPPGEDPVLVLLNGDLEKDKAFIESISRELSNRIILICWREGTLTDPKSDSNLSRLKDILAAVSGIISVDSRTAEILEEYKGERPHLNVPLPIPLEVEDWNLSVPSSNRTRGIFVSGDGFDPGSQLHRSRVDLVNRLVAESKTTVTLFKEPPFSIEGLTIPAELLKSVPSPMKYSAYLAFMGEHRFVTGFGKNPEGGDIMSDALLAQSVFIGADCDDANGELLFPDSCIKGDDIKGALKNATRLLSDQGAFAKTVERSQGLAVQLISFETVRDRLGEFINFISANSAGE